MVRNFLLDLCLFSVPQVAELRGVHPVAEYEEDSDSLHRHALEFPVSLVEGRRVTENVTGQFTGIRS